MVKPRVCEKHCAFIWHSRNKVRQPSNHATEYIRTVEAHWPGEFPNLISLTQTASQIAIDIKCCINKSFLRISESCHSSYVILVAG